MNAAPPRPLLELAGLYGVQTSYRDVFKKRRSATTEALLEVLSALGAPVNSQEDIAVALREKRQARWRRPIEPVLVAWDIRPFEFEVRLPAGFRGNLAAELEVEGGESRRFKWRWADLPVRQSADVEGAVYLAKRLAVPGILPHGYHRLKLKVRSREEDALVVAAPLKACLPAPGEYAWGVFLPLYSLYTRRSLALGDYSDFRALMGWLAGLGGNLVSTLPILPQFPEEREPSPYLPISKLFWSELYADISQAPELGACPEARNMIESAPVRRESGQLREMSLADYRRSVALRRPIIEALARCSWDSPVHRQAIDRFVREHPEVELYTRFRAAVELNGPWRKWPASRQNTITEGDYREDARLYHLYAQRLACDQVDSLHAAAREKGVRLYLDLPIGVHPDGFDVWRERDIFLPDLTTGAPPDAVFTRGQDWLSPPLHPEKIREQGYRYMRAYLKHHLARAGILRIDHIMSLHRLFVIPRGMEPDRGLYLRYPTDELYAILALESNRHQAVIVGEDLGTVPPDVGPAMRRHGLNHMYVLHYELAVTPGKVREPKHGSAASLNTHDMPPFAALWSGSDIDDWLKMGMLSEAEAARARRERRATLETLTAFLREGGWLASQLDERSALKACLSFLSASRAAFFLVSLEDLWLERDSQNIPGVQGRCPNWRRKARYSLDEFRTLPEVRQMISLVDHLRRERYGKTSGRPGKPGLPDETTGVRPEPA